MASTDMVPHLLILAAGTSTRMGGPDKLLLPVAGTPLLAHVARTALATGLPVTVVLPPDRPLRQAALAGFPVHCVIVAADGGMGASLAAGVATLPSAAPVIVLLADMPEITAQDIERFVAEWKIQPDHILRATDERGTPGHPVGFPAWARPELLDLTGDQGARQVLLRHADCLHSLALPGSRAVTDIDTPEDWHKWQGRAP
jgi:molybdenum cofactor cytidylyltransferase